MTWSAASITVRVRLFAMLRERAGWRDQQVVLPVGVRVADAWSALVEQVPALAPYGTVVRFARNGRYAGVDELLADGDELAVIPPVAGGAEGAAGADGGLRLELTPDPIDDDLLAELRRTVPTSSDGAVVLFVGQTRETPGAPSPLEDAAAAQVAGAPVEALDYEAYDAMALDVLREIAAEVEQQFGVRRLAVVHRTGHVALGEASVVICVAAPHRDAAFDACRYAIEELKARAPIWKRERYSGGAVWVAARGSHADG